tara:strand:+ start:50 stop:379 length:330 start_codon:yes stop_codon:yes gene_type:complete
MLSITNLAKSKLKELVSKNGKAAFLYLRGGGCSGFEYKFQILQEDKKPSKIDDVVKVDDINLYVCGTSLMHIIGTNIDYKEDIMGSRFDFTNDNISSKCGCGTSVNFKD